MMLPFSESSYWASSDNLGLSRYMGQYQRHQQRAIQKKFGWPVLQYPRVSYTDLDNLTCKKSEEEVSSDAEGGEHSYAACAPS